MSGTRERILDTAERLFSQQGYAATSLRQIIGEAGVNLAAIHYHFGNKEELLDEVVLRRAGPMNQERMALLERFEAEAGEGPLRIEKVLEAFLAPALASSHQGAATVKLMGRLYGEDLMPKLIARHFQNVVARFMHAVRRAEPELGEADLAWRIHFMVGAMAHTLKGPPDRRRVAHAEPPERVVARLVTFLSAGFRAPAPSFTPGKEHR
jgi:AcrR family transcriptional regulator